MSIVFAISEMHRPGGASVVDAVYKRLDNLDMAIPYTTRSRRGDDDRDDGFVFTSREVFEEMIQGEEFLEYASVFENYYGTPAKCVQRAEECGRDVLIKVDQGGLAQIKQKIPGVVSILILPGKSAEGPHALCRAVPRFDAYDHVVINDHFEESTDRLFEIIRSAQLRRS